MIAGQVARNPTHDGRMELASVVRAGMVAAVALISLAAGLCLYLWSCVQALLAGFCGG